ncbi:MAG: Npt1/Npt2 family nucleotide transporter [Parachlamydiales bacterium]|jgi:AAA family ATP:ADP antiporter
MSKIVKSSWFSKKCLSLTSINPNEISRVLLLFSIFFLGAFIFHMVRDLKDTLIITAENSGAEVIPFLKFWLILPTCIFITFLCNKLFNIFSYMTLGTILILGFILFLLFFVFFLYPRREDLYLNKLASYLEVFLPKGCNGIILIIRYWLFSLFYVVCELWGVMVLSLFLWRYVNDITSMSDAKRFYPIILLSENLSGIASGPTSYYISNRINHLFIGNNLWEQSLIFLILIIVICAGILILLFHRLYSISSSPTHNKIQEPKEKMSLKKNFKSILNSKILFSITIMVLCYQIAGNLLEVIWKSQVRILYPSPGSYNAYMSQVTMWVGIISVILSISMSGIFRRIERGLVAMITPNVILVTSLFFLPLLILHNSFNLFMAIPLSLIVFIGSMQNVLIKASKFSIFDATKEMSFVSLNTEDRRNGKSAIDGIGSRLGKSGGAVLYQGFLITFGSISASMPYIGMILLFVIIPSFLKATRKLSDEISSSKTLESL